MIEVTRSQFHQAMKEADAIKEPMVGNLTPYCTKAGILKGRKILQLENKENKESNHYNMTYLYIIL